jgi:hypothetical protein
MKFGHGPEPKNIGARRIVTDSDTAYYVDVCRIRGGLAPLSPGYVVPY